MATWSEMNLSQLKNDPEFETEVLLLEINELIAQRLIDKGMRRADLARKLGVSKAFVTKLLDGNRNVTISTLVRVFNALELKAKVSVLPRHIVEFLEGEEEFVDFDGYADSLSEVEDDEKIALAA